QQNNILEVKRLYEDKFAQMQRIIDIAKSDKLSGKDIIERNNEMLRGKKVMDNLRSVINRIKSDENNLLKKRLEQQQIYITYTPYLLAIAALISILITGIAYMRIKKDLDTRIIQQK